MFDVAVGERAIHHMGHVKMMAAAQPFLSGAISKTVNLPAEATIEDVAETYMQGWKLGLKALAIYRDGSKTAQALRTEAQDEAEAARPHGFRGRAGRVDAAVKEALASAPPKRRRMPRSASRSPTSSRSPGTRATSRPAPTRTAPSARSSSPTSARRARRCAA